jgi:hypothetical protein
MQPVHGWLLDDEATLLIETAVKSLFFPADHPVIVEIGSYCGRSTVALGLTAREIFPRARVYAIDPHKGSLTAPGGIPCNGTPSFEEFSRNITEAGLDDIVVPVVDYSYNILWNLPVRLLFIDGLHDYENVSRDFHHFEKWVDSGGISSGGYVAFHDYSVYYPGVMTLVDEVLASGAYTKLGQASSLIVLGKL